MGRVGELRRLAVAAEVRVLIGGSVDGGRGVVGGDGGRGEEEGGEDKVEDGDEETSGRHDGRR